MSGFFLHAAPAENIFNEPGIWWFIIAVVAFVLIYHNRYKLAVWFGSGKVTGNDGNQNGNTSGSIPLTDLNHAFVPADEENIVKSYECSKVFFPKCTGFLTVTDKRVIFHGSSQTSRIVYEVKLNTISGLNTAYGRKIMWLLLLIGAALVIAGLLSFQAALDIGRYSSSLGGFALIQPLVMLAVGIFLIIKSFRRVFKLKIYSSQADGSPIDVGGGFSGLFGGMAVLALTAAPTDQTDQMMLELGALIDRLQVAGAAGLKKQVKKTISVFEGNELQSAPPQRQTQAEYYFQGHDNTHVALGRELLSRHLMFLGGIGMGKTTALNQLVTQIKARLTSNDVVIIFDTKGDFYNNFKTPESIVISADDLAQGGYWNIFFEIGRNGTVLEEDIQEIARSLFYEETIKSNQPFFPNAATDIFAAILTIMLRHKDRFQLDNEGLRNFIDGATIENLKEILEQEADLAALTSYVGGADNEMALSIVSELQQAVRKILIGNFKKPGYVSMREIVRRKGGQFVFIEYNLGIGNTLTPIYRLLFDMAIKEALSRSSNQGNVWLITDEFRLLPHLQHVDNAVNFGRSLGVKFIIGVQNVSQLYEVYGHDRAQSILSGFSSSVTFRSSDWATRDFIKGLYGENRKMDLYTSNLGNKELSENISRAHVVEDWDILNLKRGHAVIGLPEQEPFLFHFKP